MACRRNPSQAGTRLSFADIANAWVGRAVAEKRTNGLVLTFDEEFRKFPGIEIPGTS